MKYLKAYARICVRHSEKNCEGCPFSVDNTGSTSCLGFILKHPEDAQTMILRYAEEDREKREELARKQREMNEFWEGK